MKSNSKRCGYALIFLLCVLPIIFSALAGAANTVFKFIEYTDAIVEKKFDTAKIEEMVSEKIENFKTYDQVLIPGGTNIENILLSTDTRFFGSGKFEVKIYSMNYTFSSAPSAEYKDIQNLPPAKKSKNGEKYFFIRGTREKNGVPPYHAETAIVVSGDSVNILWRREFVAY